MEADHLQEIAARDQFWSTIRVLQPAIEKLAAGQFDNTETERKMIQLLSRVVVAELQYRAKHAASE